MELMGKLFDICENNPRFTASIGYNSISDYCVAIYDRKGKSLGDWGNPIISTQDCDRDKAVAEAYHKFTDFMTDQCGGY